MTADQAPGAPRSNAFDTGETKPGTGKNAPHICSFNPCPHLELEAERRARAEALR